MKSHARQGSKYKEQSTKNGFLQVHNLMIIRSQIYSIVNPIDRITAMPGQQRCNVDVALLQGLSGIKKIERSLNLPVYGFIPAYLGAVKTRAQTVDLIIDLSPAFIQGLGERGIDAPKLLL